MPNGNCLDSSFFLAFHLFCFFFSFFQNLLCRVGGGWVGFKEFHDKYVSKSFASEQDKKTKKALLKFSEDKAGVKAADLEDPGQG